MDLSTEMLEEIYEAAAPRVALPCSIGPYRLHREIGRGSCGRVYQAIDTTLNHPVAVKLLADYASDLSEARKAVAVEHPNVVRVFAAGHHEGIAYIVYEFIDGPRMDQYLATRSARERIRVVRDVARGAAACHGADIVHGDIRTRNILMDGDRPKLADFGMDTIEGATKQDDVADLFRLAGLAGKPPPSADLLVHRLNKKVYLRRRMATSTGLLIALAIVGWVTADRVLARQEALAAARHAATAEALADRQTQKMRVIGTSLSMLVTNARKAKEYRDSMKARDTDQDEGPDPVDEHAPDDDQP